MARNVPGNGQKRKPVSRKPAARPREAETPPAPPAPEVVDETPVGFVHGPDVTITRAHIADAQLSRARQRRPPLTPDQLVRVFIHFPKGRHFKRAWRLMKGHAESTSAPAVEGEAAAR